MVRRHVVVVSGDAGLLRYLSRLLRMSGYRTSTFLDAEKALESLDEGGGVDLIITDLTVHEPSGWRFCRRLRSPQFPGHNETPVLVLSATGCWTRDLGAHASLAVPFTAEQLRGKVSEVLNGDFPRLSLRVLLAGFETGCSLEREFARHGYAVESVAAYDDAAAALGLFSWEVVVVRGDCPSLLTSVEGVTRVQVLTAPQAETLLTLLRDGIHAVTEPCLPEYLVEVTEQARYQKCLASSRELLEERTAALQLSQASYTELFESIPDLVMLLEGEGQIVRVNEAGALMLGQTPGGLEGQSLVDLLEEPHRSSVHQALEQTLLYGNAHYEVQMARLGFELVLEVQQRLLQSSGKPLVLAIARDVRERHRAKEMVQVSDTRYRIIAENTYDWEFWLSPGGHFLFNSPACERVTGYTAHDFENEDQLIGGLVHPQDRALFARHWVTLSEDSRTALEFEFRLVHRDGSVRWCNHVSQPVYDAQGNFLGSRGSHRDITERRRQQEERDLLAAAVEHSAEAILLTDAEGLLTYVNPAFERISGYPRADVLGQMPSFLYGAEYPQIRRALAEGRSWTGSCLRTRADRTTYDVEFGISPVRDGGGQILNFVCVERDVTQERKLQSQLRQSQKLEAIGTLAGGIAHDFNNLLSGILGYAGMIKLSFSGATGNEVYRSADVIERTARRAAELTQKLLGFARQGKNQHVNVNVQTTIGDCIELLSHTIDKRIHIKVSHGPGQPCVMGDPVQISQILLNLAINARDAMEGGGELTFETTVETLKEGASLDTSVVEASGDFVVIRVSDTGCGMKPEDRARIFEPFFTTKEPGKGTGMGLAMVYGIVKNHHGYLRVDSRPGQGSTFWVYLPAAQAVRPVAEVQARKPIRGTGTVLLVDDEELIRDMATRMLTHLGYQVTTARDGREACELYARIHESIDLVIIDMVMPNMTGSECFKQLRGANPQAKVILSSGYSMNETAQSLLDQGLVGFIQKPYQLGQLSEVVASALPCSLPQAV